MTLSELLAIVDRDYALQGRRTLRDARYRARRLLRDLGDVPVSALTAEVLEAYQARRLAEGAARNTVNNALNLLRRGFALARRLGRVDHAPWIRRLHPGPPRSGFLAAADARRLVAACRSRSPVLADAVELLYGLGWRREEVLGLQWDEVDLEAGTLCLPAAREKTGQARTVSLTPAIREVLARRWDLRDGPLVFHRRGRRVRCTRDAWRGATEEIGRPGLKVHDLRRSFARNALAAGVPQRLIMSTAGWRTAAVFHRYAIVDEEALGDALQRLQEWTDEQLARPARSRPAPVVGFRLQG